MRRTTFAVLAVAAALLSCLLASSAAMAQAPTVIDATDSSGPQWTPPNVTVGVGDVVRWEFDDAAADHTLTSTSANWTVDETREPDGPAIERSFAAAGTYTFRCRFHGAMTGSVTVEDTPSDELENVLVFSKTAGFRHSSIPNGIAAIELLGTQNGFEVDATEDAAQFNDANLAQYDVVVWLSTTGDVLNADQQAAFRRYIQAGGGYAGIHAAADTEYTWAWYGEMLGGYFRNHPPGTPAASVDITDADEPSTETVPARWARTDEWYNYQTFENPVVNGGGPDYSPRNSGVHVLATVDEGTYDEDDGTDTTNDDHPIAWCSEFDGGTAWYTGMGHTEGSFTEPDFLEHVLGGIQTAARSEEADCGEARQATPSAEDFEKVTLDDDTQNPFELDVAADGRVFYIERNGQLRIWKPDTEQTVTAGTIPVSTAQENGLMGLQLAPDFETSNHVYLTYAALPNESNQQRVSRFTMDGDTMVASSEVIIYTWQAQRAECCHSAGSLYFGPDGSLYISVGDNTNPFASDGYTPIDEQPGRQAWDAQRTSGNTNNSNGKILRILPMANPTGPPGVGTTYTIPPGNLFAPGTAQTLPEIFAMGFRNPFRFTVDPDTGWVLMGDYGPDAPGPNPTRGPRGSVEFNAVTSAGNYGWPYCIRQNTPYNDFTFPSGPSGAPFNCNAPTNNSPNNTGLTNLPAARPATMWLTYSNSDTPVDTDTRFPELGFGGAPTGGPMYRYDADNPSGTKFPEYYDGEWFIGEWNNGWIKHASLDGSGNATDVRTFPYLGPAGCQPNAGNTGCYKRPMDMDFGPDGSLYLIEWGAGFGGNNENSGIYRIDYIAEGRRPIAVANANPTSGQPPLTVNFSSEGSVDPEGTSLTYAWDFDNDGDVDSTDPNPTFTYNERGTYNASLRVTDQAGQTGVDNVQIVVGNTAPTVTIDVPLNGQFAEFGDEVPYEISVTDPEDGSTAAGTISCDDVTLNISLGHDAHAHELQQEQGCEGTFPTLNAAGHGEAANTFTVIEAVYTDEAQTGGAVALTGRDEAILPRKRKQAEHFTTTGRASDSTATGGDPGVQTETTTDPQGGGLNVGFIENGDYVSYNPMNLKDIDSISFRVASGGAGGGTIQVRQGSATGPIVATSPPIPNTGGWQSWTDVEVDLTDPPETTEHLFFVARHPTDNTGGLFNINWIQFKGKGAAVTAAPEVTATADPITGTAPLQVAFDAEATDPEGAALTYAWDFGVAGTSDDTSTEEDPTYTYQRPGTYTASVTVTDADGGEATAQVEVRVTSSDQCPTGPVRSDEFDGDALDTNRWSVVRPDSTRPPTVSGGNLNFPIDQGSLYGPGTSARNIVVQPLPEGDVQVTAKITTEPLVENYQQAGLRVYSDDANWASIHMIHAGGARDFEFIYENANNPRNEGADKLGGIPADAPLTYWVRIVRTGNTLTAFYSYDGVQFDPVGRTADISSWTNPRIGPVALSDQAPTFPVARFDWIRFNPDSGGGGGGGGGNEVVDNFDGTELASPPWEVVRQNQDLTVSDGALRIPAATGDIYGGRNDASNLTLRDAPDGEWTATTKLNFEGTAQYHQAGIIIYGDDSNFTKFGRIAHTAAGDEKFEFIYENAGTPRNEGPDSTPNIAADFPDDFWVRMTSDGANVTGAYSTDGETWTPVGRPAPLPANARIGLFAFSNDGAGNPVAAFDSFTLAGPDTSGPSRDDQFDGSTLDTDRWNAIVRGNAATRAVAGGELTITTEPGDIYTVDSTPPPNNFILQSADHAGADWTIETKLSGTINGGYGQGGLIAYSNGDNWVKLNPISDAGNTRINRIELRSETAGTPVGPTGSPDPVVPVGTTDYWVRLTKAGTTYSGEYSYDGETWTPMGTVTNAMASPDFGVYAFGPQPDAQGDTVSFDYFTLDGDDEEPCECTGFGDDFESGTVSTERWNNIIREQSDLYTVQDGNLNITTVNGDIYTGGDPAPTRNFFLQSADHAGEDWVIETHVDAGELSGGYEQAGLMARVDDDNYIKYDIISDDGQTVLNRLELRSEVDGAIVAPENNVPTPAGTTEVWLRLTKSGNNYTADYSWDGVTWSSFPAPVVNAMADPSFGLFTLGVNSGGGTAHFDYFSLDGDATGCEEPEPENRPPAITEVTASPTIGFGPLEVDFDVTASDPDEGDELTYSWDFGDGSAASTAEDPTHTYTAPGEYEAEVTVSDGEESTSQTVDVQVLEPDDAGARFRTLVFSKTAGFRHSSIDEGHTAIETLGEEENFQVDHTEDSTAFRADVLSHYDTVVWLSTTGDVLNTQQQDAFEAYIGGGGGYAGIHSASDTEYDWNWYGHLVGAYFMSHPANQTATLHVEDQEHPSTAGLPASYSRLDEWYNYKSPDFADPNVPDGDYSPRGAAGIQILERLDESSYNEDDGNATDDDHPITWCQQYDGGRSWYTGQGHVEDSYNAAHAQNILQQILGGIETTAGVASAEGCAGDPDAPQDVEAFADPQSGDAPLLVQFSATGLDPQGRPLEYHWDFGDGSSRFAQSPEHVYTEPGNYTARVTATDPQGKSGTDTVQITVTDDGNVMPTVRAAADPASGMAPLEVVLSAQGRDPDGDSSRLTYFWEFGDESGGTAFGREVRHTYMETGTYTATVTVTDEDGGSASAEIEIEVGDPPGNVPPTVQAAADPQNGSAPLRVSFTSAATDPDGDQVSSVWDFGDGVRAGGQNAVHTYTTPGTYTATVTVRDPGGASASDSVTITVTGTLAGSNSQPPPAGPGAVTPSETRQAGPLMSVAKAKKVRQVIKRGLRYRVSCADACRVTSVLKLSGRRLGVAKATRIGAGDSRTLVVRLDRNIRRNLVDAMRSAGVKRLTATLVTKVRTADGTKTLRAKVALKL